MNDRNERVRVSRRATEGSGHERPEEEEEAPVDSVQEPVVMPCVGWVGVGSDASPQFWQHAAAPQKGERAVVVSPNGGVVCGEDEQQSDRSPSASDRMRSWSMGHQMLFLFVVPRGVYRVTLFAASFGRNENENENGIGLSRRRCRRRFRYNGRAFIEVMSKQKSVTNYWDRKRKKFGDLIYTDREHSVR